MIKFLLTAAACFAMAGQAVGQNIKGHYVAKTETDGTIYHTFPSALFENKNSGDLVFDITYKSSTGRRATINFTYEMKAICPIDSVCFICGQTRMRGVAEKIYISSEKKAWKHRYTFSADLKPLCVFFDTKTTPSVELYAQGRIYVYNTKPSAWKNYAPIGYKIFEMIRMNEQY